MGNLQNTPDLGNTPFVKILMAQFLGSCNKTILKSSYFKTHPPKTSSYEARFYYWQWNFRNYHRAVYSEAKPRH